MDEVIADLVEAGLTEGHIDKMSQYDLMSAYLEWHGIIGHTEAICSIMHERWRDFHTRQYDERGFEIVN